MAPCGNKGGSELYASYSRNTIPYEYSNQLKTENSNGNIYYNKEFEKISVNAQVGYGDSYNESRNESYNKMFMPEFTQNSYSESQVPTADITGVVLQD